MAYLNRRNYLFNNYHGAMFEVAFLINHKQELFNKKFYWIIVDKNDGKVAVSGNQEDREKNKFFEFRKYPI
jgi:hypothetical protein